MYIYTQPQQVLINTRMHKKCLKFCLCWKSNIYIVRLINTEIKQTHYNFSYLIIKMSLSIIVFY